MASMFDFYTVAPSIPHARDAKAASHRRAMKRASGLGTGTAQPLRTATPVATVQPCGWCGVTRQLTAGLCGPCSSNAWVLRRWRQPVAR
jgi:hypothetical protein